jgi:hypothetical protein
VASDLRFQSVIPWNWPLDAQILLDAFRPKLYRAQNA